MDDHRSAGINVKVYNTDPVPGQDKLSEEELNQLWEICHERFWTNLQNTVSSDGLAETVYAEGRMGGWVVPDPAIAPGTPEWTKFAEIVEGEMTFYLETVWPEMVKERAEKVEAERLRDDPYIEVKLRRSAAATIAGLVGTEDDVQAVVNFEDGDPRAAVTAETETWDEVRGAFPIDLFAEHGEWVGKDEEES